ncbi:MAG: class I SAM-dependent methyltransferase [Acidobacteriota bacterium]|nr:class I SAM-dependent methyltransferase [Acidobacteriota bacterium]
MKNVIESVVESLDGFDVGLYPHLPYLLQDLWRMGSDPETMVSLLKKEGVVRPRRVLDVGCGKGAVSIRIAEELGCPVTGIDAVPAFIDAARRRATEHRVGRLCRFVIGDIRARTWEPEKFDAIVFGALGSVLGDLQETLTIPARSLNDRGYVLLDDGYLEDAAPTAYDRCLRKSIFYGQIAAAGFEVVAEAILGKEEIEATDRSYYISIERRAVELMRRFPDQAGLFQGYLDAQERENSVLENDLVCGTWLLRIK